MARRLQVGIFISASAIACVMLSAAPTSAQYYPYRPVFDTTGGIRIQAKPREAIVYVDGYFAGTVDDFDGMLQRLIVPAGGHEVVLYLEGYRSVHEKILIRPGATHTIRQTMERLGAGETNEPRPVPDKNAPHAGVRERDPRERRRPDARERGENGSLSVRVQPAGATLLIDGQEWTASGTDDPLVVQLSAGLHQVEVRKDGYRSYSATVEVRPGDTAPLNISLSPIEPR